jgi:Alkylmercury lyase
MSNPENPLLWPTRHFIYQHFAETAQPPTVETTAQHLGIAVEQAATLYHELHERHALLLEPGTVNIRMANPFSAVPTPFRVASGGQNYFANCAWDALGIPAALQQDGLVQATCAGSATPLVLTIQSGQIDGAALVYFALPFRQWYDDLVYT